jgi:hypothetical protein
LPPRTKYAYYLRICRSKAAKCLFSSRYAIYVLLGAAVDVVFACSRVAGFHRYFWTRTLGSRAIRSIRRGNQEVNLAAARAFALAATSSLVFGGALVSSEVSSRIAAAVTSSTAERNAASFAFEGLVKPLIFLTNCSEAARVSSGVTEGSKLKSVLMFLHIGLPGI